MKKILILLLLIFSLTGCVQQNPDIKIHISNEDNIEKINGEIILTDQSYDRLDFVSNQNSISKKTFADNLVNKTAYDNGLNISSLDSKLYDKNNTYIFSLEVNENEPITKIEKGYVLRLYEYSIPDNNEEYQYPGNINISIYHNNVVDSNADSVENNKYKWFNIKLNRTLYYSTGSLNIVQIILFILSLISGSLLVYYRKYVKEMFNYK